MQLRHFSYGIVRVWSSSSNRRFHSSSSIIIFISSQLMLLYAHMLNYYVIFHIILLIEEVAYCSQLNSLSKHYIPSILFHLLLPQFTGTTAIWQLSLALSQTTWKTQHQTTSSLLSIKASCSITAFWVVDYYLVSSLTPLLHDIAQHYFSNDTFLLQGSNTYSFLIPTAF